MKLLVASDVHHPEPRRVYSLYMLLEREKPDVLLIAGDIVDHPALAEISKFLAKRRRRYRGPVVAVAGNHEHWLTRGEMSRGMTSLEKIEALAELYAKHDVILLDTMGPYCLDEVCFAGVTGWFDYSYASNLGYTREHFENCNPWGCSLAELESCEKRPHTCLCPNYRRDCIYVKLGDMTAPEYAELNAERLREQLYRIPAGRPTVVLLHHVPRRDLLRYTGDPRRDFYYAYAGHEKLDHAIRGSNRDIRLVVYGHVHEDSIDWEVERDNIKYINGYRYAILHIPE